jgi:hypothetical protein
VVTPFIMVRSFLQRREPSRQVDWRPSPCPGVFRLAFTDRSPTCLQTTSRSRGRVMRREDKEGRVISLSSSPSLQDPDLGGWPAPALSPPIWWSIGFSLSLQACISLLEALFTSHHATSVGGLTSQSSPRLPSEPSARP